MILRRWGLSVSTTFSYVYMAIHQETREIRVARSLSTLSAVPGPYLVQMAFNHGRPAQMKNEVRSKSIRSFTNRVSRKGICAEYGKICCVCVRQDQHGRHTAYLGLYDLDCQSKSYK